MLDLYTEGKISKVSRSICPGLKREEWTGVSSTESDSVRPGFPSLASSRRRQQQREPKPKQRSHLRSFPAFGFLCLLSCFLTNMQSISPRRSFLSRYFPIKHLSGRTAGLGHRETLGRAQQLLRAGRLWAAWVGRWHRFALGERQWLQAGTFTAVLPIILRYQHL